MWRPHFSHMFKKKKVLFAQNNKNPDNPFFPICGDPNFSHMSKKNVIFAQNNKNPNHPFFPICGDPISPICPRKTHFLFVQIGASLARLSTTFIIQIWLWLSFGLPFKDRP